MKKIYRPLLKGTNWALVGLLGLLGFPGCDSIGADEYGQPYTEYTLKGKVTNLEGKGIPDIEITATTGRDVTGSSQKFGAVQTDPQGEYQLTIDTFNQREISVYAEDIDGEKNGSFEADSVHIPKEEVELKGKKGWFGGRGNKTVDFSLKEKATEEE